MTIEIVPFAAISDVQREAAGGVLVRAFAHQPATWRTLEEARAEVATFFEDPDRSALAAIEGGAILGWIGVIRSYSRAWELHPIAVDPDHQRRGVGRRLVAALEDRVRAAGVITLYLGSDDDFGGTSLFGADPYPDLLASLAAIEAVGDRHPLNFYRRCGFALSGLIPDANGPGKPDILMAKRI